MGKKKSARGYDGVGGHDSVYEDDAEGGMLANSRDAATRRRAYEGERSRPTRWICCSVIGTVVVLLLAAFAGGSTEAGRELGRQAMRSVLTRSRDRNFNEFHEKFTDRNFQSSPSPLNIRQNLRDLTQKPHIAGSLNDLETAEYLLRAISLPHASQTISRPFFPFFPHFFAISSVLAPRFRKPAPRPRKTVRNGRKTAGKKTPTNRLMTRSRYVRDKMHEFGWEADLVKYDVLLMYPKVEEGRPYAELTARCEPDRGDCAGMGPSGDSFTARLEEEVYAEDDLGDRGPEDNPAPWGTSQLPFPTFNGYSPSTPEGGVSAPVVYANYARREDFELLAKMGVNVTGAVVLARYGRLFRGSKADNAHNAGAVALLIYSDPKDYAPLGTEPEHVYPSTRYLPPTGVQRGTIFTGSGDPLTPGHPSTSDALRLDPQDRAEYITSAQCPSAGGCTTWGTERLLPVIPTHPISYEDARPFLLNLGGDAVPEGNSASPVQHTTGDWRGAVPDVTYRFGDTVGPSVVTASLTLRSNITQAPIWNVVTVIPGDLDPEHVAILGNHRDAWGAPRSTLPVARRQCSRQGARSQSSGIKDGSQGGRSSGAAGTPRNTAC